MLYTGIDLHRQSIVVCTVDETGTIIERRAMKTQPELVTTYFHQWSVEHHAVVECTTGWYWLCDLLRTLGIHIVPAHAKYLKAICYAKVKTDAVDAKTLANLLRMGYVPEAHQLPPEYRAMRDLLSRRHAERSRSIRREKLRRTMNLAALRLSLDGIYPVLFCRGLGMASFL